MPFTLSHPVFSLLLYKWIRAGKLSATGLILGCMAPDFEYFLRMKMQGNWGHQWWGMLCFDLPIALLVALFFHGYIRDALIRHAPQAMKRRFSVFYQLDWWHYFKQYYMRIILSVVLGMLSHVLWDAFTHNTGFFVQYFVGLQQSITLGQLSFPIYKVIQHGSSLLGLMIIGIYVYCLPKASISIASSRFNSVYFWGGVLLCFSLFLGVWAGLNPDLILKIGHVMVASIACLFYSVLVLCMVDDHWQKNST